MIAYEVLEDIENLRETIKKHRNALKALEVADTEVLKELNDFEEIFKKEVDIMEEKTKTQKDEE